MSADVEALLDRLVHDDEGAVVEVGTVIRRAGRRRRRRRIAAGVATVVVVGVMGLAAGGIVGDTNDDLPVAAGDGAGSVVRAVLADLGGRSAVVDLPPGLGAGFEVHELAAGLTVEGREWHVDARRDGDLEREPVAECVVGHVGPWAVVFSGDGMTQATCEALSEELDRFELRDGQPYVWPGFIGPVSAPAVAARTDTARLSLFWRSCEAPDDGRTTPSGLSVHRITDPARGSALTVLCDPTGEVELWIETPEPLETEQVDAVAIRPESREVAVPDVTGLPVDEASQLLHELGILGWVALGDPDAPPAVVSGQRPAPGTIFRSAGRVELFTTLPDAP